MDHVVFFPGPDGAAAFRRVPTLDEAVRLVEHLRNVDGVTDVSVHALVPVPLAFRAYYRVELPVTDVPPAADATPVDLPARVEAVAPVEVASAALPADTTSVADGTAGPDDAAFPGDALEGDAPVHPGAVVPEQPAGAHADRGVAFFAG